MKKSLKLSKRGFGLVFGVASVTVLSAAAQAAGSTHELIVRYREPQNHRSMAIDTTMNALGSSAGEVSVVNSSEGIVKLKFKSEEEVLRAREVFETTSGVVSVAPNLYYKPAIKYSFKVAKPEALSPSFFALPFARALVANPALRPEPPVGNLPDVLPAPASAQIGPDPRESTDWAVASIRMPDYGAVLPLIKQTIITAVTDTGVDYNHEDLVAGMWRKPGNDREVGFDTVHNHAKPFDVVKFDIDGCLKDWTCALGIDQSKYLVNPGHGTHCAGHVGAVANNSLGIRGMGAKATQVMGLKFFYDFGEANAGQGDDAAAIKAIDYAIANGAKVISASWGGRMKPADAEASELKQALIRAQKAGVLLVFAAGNDAINQETDATPGYPAKYDLDNMIVVAATDKDDSLAKFSSYGPQSVHIGAPGVKILSTTVGSQYSDIVGSYTDPQSGQLQTLDWDGTSMATPIVAGAAALLWSMHPDWTYHQIKAQLLNTSRKVPGLNGKITTGGVLDVRAALGI